MMLRQFKHQVFVSSTYVDLKIERAEVMQALLELECMPAGMELFPSANAEQWDWIKKVIDESDYYVVIIGNRYGSVNSETNLSYTEMEYRYALDSNIPIVAFLHDSPESIQYSKSEISEIGRNKLESFRELCKQKLCKTWNSASDLGGKVSRSMTQLIRHNPRPGWVRIDPDELRSIDDVSRLRRENVELQNALESLKSTRNVETVLTAEDSARLMENMTLSWEIRHRIQMETKNGSKRWSSPKSELVSGTASWKEVLQAIAAPLLLGLDSRDVVYPLGDLGKTILALSGSFKGKQIDGVYLADSCINPIRLRLIALHAIEVSGDRMTERWTLTDIGRNLLLSAATL